VIARLGWIGVGGLKPCLAMIVVIAEAADTSVVEQQGYVLGRDDRRLDGQVGEDGWLCVA